MSFSATFAREDGPDRRHARALYSLHLTDEQITKRLVHQLLKLVTEHGLAAANRDSALGQPWK
jgi:hypothetical protein